MGEVASSAEKLQEKFWEPEWKGKKRKWLLNLGKGSYNAGLRSLQISPSTPPDAHPGSIPATLQSSESWAAGSTQDETSRGAVIPTQVPVSSLPLVPSRRPSWEISCYFSVGWTKGRYWDVLTPHSLGARPKETGPLGSPPESQMVCPGDVPWSQPGWSGRLRYLSGGTACFSLGGASSRKIASLPWTAGPGSGRPGAQLQLWVPPCLVHAREAKGGCELGSQRPAGAQTLASLSSLSTLTHTLQVPGLLGTPPGSKPEFGPGLGIQSVLEQDVTEMTTIPWRSRIFPPRVLGLCFRKPRAPPHGNPSSPRNPSPHLRPWSAPLLILEGSNS